MDQSNLDQDRGLFGITIAAELAGTGPQNLRAYEEAGLLRPDRTDGGTRRYSPNDITRLQRIARLTAGGINLAGIAMILDLQDELDRLHQELDQQRHRTPPE